MGCTLNPTALRKAKIVYNFGLSECNRVKENNSVSSESEPTFYNEVILMNLYNDVKRISTSQEDLKI